MKYSYNVKVVNTRIYFELDEGLEVVSLFLFNDIQTDNSGLLCIDKIREVQQGKLPSPYVFGGNTSVLEIRTNEIFIEELFLAKRRVFIEPDELILLIEAYINEKTTSKEDCRNEQSTNLKL